MESGAPIEDVRHLDDLIDWLLDQGLTDGGLDEVVGRMGPALSLLGLPIDRVGIGTLLLHPVLGALDVQWDAISGKVTSDHTPRDILKSPAADGPYSRAVRDADPFRRYDIGPDAPMPEFAVLQRLRHAGYTEYVVSFRDFGSADVLPWTGVPDFREGILISFSTRRRGGFRDEDLQAIRRLLRPLGVVAKAKSRQLLTDILLKTYLGGMAGEKVREGLIERGDHLPITCAIWLSDLKGSTALAERMDIEEYLPLLNSYFEIAVGAVSRHGGEVLKFIGDAVLAIFPIAEGSGSERRAVSAALAAARYALAEAEQLNLSDHGPEIAFRVALHVGDVAFGNVGGSDRLDFTAIGSAVNRAARLLDISKEAGTPVVASDDFTRSADQPLTPLGAHHVAGVAAPIEVFGLPEFAPRPATD